MFEIEIHFTQFPGGWTAFIPSVCVTGIAPSKDDARIAALDRFECWLREREDVFRLTTPQSEPELVKLAYVSDLETPASVLPQVHPGDYKLIRKVGTQNAFRLDRAYALPWGFCYVDTQRDGEGRLVTRYWSLPRYRPTESELSE